MEDNSLRRRLAAHLPIIAPLLATVVCMWASVRALYELTFATLGRDQGIFQYVAWALRHGARGYRDFHDINGPLPHMWHVLLQTLGGEDEHAFRSIDTLVLVASYAAASSTIPRFLSHQSSRIEKLVWALAGVALLGAQYSVYDWWHTSQREGLYSILVYGSIAFQVVAHQTKDTKAAFRWFALAAFLTTLTWFGKPLCVVFALLQGAVLVFDRASLSIPPRRVAIACAAGAGAAFLVLLAFVVVYEDPIAGIRLLSSVPLLHHTIWNKTLVDCYHAYGNAPHLDWSAATIVIFVVVYFVLRLPRRALLALVLPLGGFVVFAIQGKGFPYHLHMLTLGTGVMHLVLVAALANFGKRRERWADFIAIGALALGLEYRESALMSPGVAGEWARIGATASMRASRAYFDDFEWEDFYAADLREAAKYLRDHTNPTERIQTYGLDPYLLFLAQRHSASPVIYDFELDLDAALEAGTGAAPSRAQRAQLFAYRDRAVKDVFDHVSASPPAAFVFFDGAPFSYPDDSEADFARHCPSIHEWLDTRYAPARTFGTIRVRMRNDIDGP